MQRARDPRSPLYISAILFVASVCAILLAVDLMGTWRSRDASLRQARIETQNLARSLTQHSQDVFENTDILLKVLRGALVDGGADLAAEQRVGRRMQARVADQKVIDGLFLFDQQGTLLVSSHVTAAVSGGAKPLNNAELNYFRYHRNNTADVALIGPPIRSGFDGSWVITLTHRVNNPDGSFGGVIGAEIGIDAFQRFFEGFDVGKVGAITLASGQGALLVRRPFIEKDIGRNVAQSRLFEIDKAASGSFEFTSLIDGQLRLGSFRRVPGFDLIMVVALGKNEVLAPWWRDTQSHFVWMTVIVLLVALLGYRMAIQIRYRANAEAQLAISGQTLERSVIERTADLQQMIGQRDVLLREVYHRVKNNMQVVDALLAMEVRQLSDDEARQAMSDMRTRIHTLGLAHQQLMVSADLETFDIAPFLRDIAGDIRAHGAIDGPSLSVELIPLMVNLDFAIPVGLVVVELVTDCLTHVFPLESGRIFVRLQRGTANELILSVSDNSLAPAAPSQQDVRKAARRMKLVKGLAKQFDGTVTVGYGAEWQTEIRIQNQSLSK